MTRRFVSAPVLAVSSAPCGLIAPDGTFHENGRESHEDAVFRLVGVRGRDFSEACRRGWIVFSVAGAESLVADATQIARQQDPAVRTARRLAAAWVGDSFEIMARDGGRWRIMRVMRRPFVSRGALVEVSA